MPAVSPGFRNFRGKPSSTRPSGSKASTSRNRSCTSRIAWSGSSGSTWNAPAAPGSGSRRSGGAVSSRSHPRERRARRPLCTQGVHVPVAVQAIPFLAVLLAVGLVLGFAFGPWGVVPVIVLAAFVLLFFRDPARRAPEGAGLVLSPADGRVTGILRERQGVRVSIFLPVLDCHINRSPVG